MRLVMPLCRTADVVKPGRRACHTGLDPVSSSGRKSWIAGQARNDNSMRHDNFMCHDNFMRHDDFMHHDNFMHHDKPVGKNHP